MKIRYCSTTLNKENPCLCGWLGLNYIESKSCHDEPIEENCRKIVDTQDIVYCPRCGTALGIIEDYLLGG